jgi:two-component system NtrC family sensor kinase
MTEGVIVFDLEGNILSMNPAALRIHGFERPEQARRHLLQYPDVFELRYLDGRLMAVDEWPAARVLRGERFTAYEARVRRVDTGQAWIGSYSGTPVLDREGHPILGVLTLHDVTARKVAEAERQRLLGQLDAERARLAAIIDHAPEAIVVTDPSSHLVLANPATERLYGRPIPSGQGLADQADLVLCHPDGTPYEAHDLPLSRSALDGQVHANLEMALFRPGGERRDLLVSTAPILDSRGRVDGVVGIFQDTTERKQIQEAIQRYAARLQTLHDVDQAILAAESTEAIAQIALTHVRGAVGCVRASVALFDLEAGEAILLAVITDGETALPKGWRGPITGEWPVEQLRGGEISAVEDLSTVQPSMPLYENLLAEGVRSLAHLPLIAEDTLIGALNLGLPEPGGPTREQVDTAREMAAGLAISIRHSQLHAQVRRHAQELEQQVARRTAALQASQARLRAIFDGAAIGIALSDLEGRILDSNPAFRAMLGYSSQELSGLVFTEVTHPEDAAADLALFRELLAGQRDDYHLEKRYLRKDGQVLWANLTVSLVRRDEGDPVFAIGLVEDITERKQMQEALFQAEKLTIAGQLGASLAHEINNPLQAVIGCLGLAENTLQTGGDVSRYLEVAREELRRAARIVAQLRDLHRLSKEEPQERVDLNALLEEVLMLSRKKCQESGVEVVWEPAADLPPLPLVSDQVRQVFLNLILNALDAMPHGGELRVGTAWTGDPAGTHVTFADTGAGISPHALSRLFEPFFTTKPRGLGLGLYISHQIVEEHGGRIDVASQVGQGTTFTVWLPGS